MKKNNFIYALLGAIALAGAGGLSSCAETEEEAKVNPGYNPQTGDVPVKFMFNISTGSTTSSTRMSEGNVQATTSNTFRGMDQTALLSFKLASDGKHVAKAATNPEDITNTAVIADKLYGLGPILGTNAIGPDSKDKSRRILELTLPVGTNALMFWGKATKNGTDDEQGKLDATLSQDLTQTVFKLCKRVPVGTDPTAGYNTAALTNYKTLLSTILNTIVQSTLSDNVTFEGTTKAISNLTWAEYGTTTTEGVKVLTIKTTKNDKDPSNNTEPLCALGETLSKEFYVLNKIYPNEMRAGSAPAIKDMLSTLYSVIHSVATAIPTNMEEAVAKALAIQIETNMAKALQSSGTGFLGISTMLNSSHLNLTLPLPTDNDDLTKFPEIFGLPAGGTILEYDVASNEYSYKSPLPTYNMGGGTEFNPENYVYPPELCYFGNSPIRVSDSGDDSIFPEGSTNWDDESSWSAWSSEDKSVKSSTNSVAMKYNINYGTALLKTQVKYSADELQDNRAALILAREGATEANQTIDAKTKQPFALTGILIGGQNYEVGWNYLSDGNGSFSAYLYDRDLSTTQQAIPSNGEGSSNPVYTLVWDNWDPRNAGQDQHPIYIGLEFKNNSGKAFWGQNNLIPVNGTFYITGMLDPDYASAELLTSLGKTAEQFKADKKLGITWPTKYALPPYDDDGNTIKERRVFIQDFMTEATFVIGPTSLQKALVSVPDLRSAHLSVGLSVDLNWSTGMKFENVVLGNTGN